MHSPRRAGRIFIGRFEHDADLLKSLTDYCRHTRIRLAVFSVIGAVRKASFSFYDQKRKSYLSIKKNRPMEIASCTGNVSVKDGEVFVHAHCVYSDARGTVFGGHLNPGTVIFAAEFVIQELKGPLLSRKNEPRTGLTLWV